jgi:hypothetical protein
MTRPRRTRLDDPTAENTADTSTQSASGLSPGSGDQKREKNRAENDDLVRRTTKGRDDTPRRYEEPAEDDEVMP